jgi:hypothetical protein
MSESSSGRWRVSRESRLLLLTVAVCIVALVLLARLRFPASPPVVESPAAAPAPLERLAARASYDALAADIERVEPIIAPSLIVLRVAAPLPSAPRDVHDALVPSDAPPLVRHVAAVRIGRDIAVAAIDSGTRIDGIVGERTSGTASVLSVDPVRRIGLVRVPEAPVRQLPQLPLASLPTPLYVVVVEGTQAGVTLRPVFLGRGDRFTSSRWSRPLLPLGGIAVTPGALLFSLAGEFIGTVVMENGAPTIAGAQDVVETGERLAGTAPPVPANAGIAVQALTSPLRAALAVRQGVVVSNVDRGGPADGQLEVADVITAVGEWSTDSPDDLLLRLASQQAGDMVTMTVVRNGETRTAALVLQPTPVAPAEATSIAFVTARGVGTRVIESSSGIAESGLEPGDLVVRAGATRAPTAAQVRRVLAQPTPSGLALLVITRQGHQRVVAVPAGGRDDATGR